MMRYKYLLSQPTSRPLAPTDLNPQPPDASHSSAHMSDSTKARKPFNGAAITGKIYRVLSLSKGRGKESQPAPGGRLPTPNLKVPLGASAPMQPGCQAEVHLTAPRVDEPSRPRIRVNSPLAPRARHSWHADTLLFAPQRPQGARLPQPRRMTSFSYHPSPRDFQPGRLNPEQGQEQDTPPPLPTKPRKPNLTPEQRALRDELHHYLIPPAEQERPRLHIQTQHEAYPGQYQRPVGHRRPLGQMHTNTSPPFTPIRYTHAQPGSSLQRPLPTPPVSPADRSTRLDSQITRIKRKPAPSYHAIDSFESTPSARVTPVRRWDPLKVPRKASAAGRESFTRVKVDSCTTSPTRQFVSKEAVCVFLVYQTLADLTWVPTEATLRTPPTPYFCRLNDTSTPPPSRSPSPSPAPSPASLGEPWWEPDPQSEDESVNSALEEMYDDVLASWGLPPASAGRRLVRSQSVPLDLHFMPSASVCASHQPSQEPRLTASTTGPLSSSLQRDEARNRRGRHDELIQPIPKFYPSGRSFATIRAKKGQNGRMYQTALDQEEGPGQANRPNQWEKDKDKERTRAELDTGYSKRQLGHAKYTPVDRIGGSGGEPRLEMGRWLPTVTPLGRTLTGRVKKAVQRIEGEQGDSPLIPLTPIREIGKILTQPTSVSSIGLGEESKRMMAEAREKKSHSKLALAEPHPHPHPLKPSKSGDWYRSLLAPR